LVSLSSQNTNNFDINKKMLKKINILYKFCHNFNYSSISFIKLKPNIKVLKPKLLCIHIIFKQKNKDLIKIQYKEKKYDNKKKRDVNLAFLTFFIISFAVIFIHQTKIN
jgi:hypothetical protein